MRERNVLVTAKDLGKLYLLFNRPPDRLKHALLWRLGKTYGHPLWALRGVSFELCRGETVGIIGRNGSGKSTLLQILAGILQPTEGNFSATGTIASLLELGSGFNPDYSGRENIFINAAILGVSHSETTRMLDEILAFADIGDYVDQPVKFYSSGMFLRLAFSVQVCLHPDIFIVDEALAVGDISFQRKCYRRIKELRSKGVLTILVSHDLNAITNFCDRALLLDRGELIAEGSPPDICDLYQKRLFGEYDPGTIKEYGDGGAQFLRIWFENQQGEAASVHSNGERLVFCYEVQFNRPVQNPIFGMRITNIHGVLISATNTSLMGRDTGQYATGDIAAVKWHVEIPLAPGAYFFSCGCSYEEVDQFLCRNLDVLKLQVIGSFRNSGLLDNVHEVVIANKND